jgi:hypothetical protein
MAGGFFLQTDTDRLQNEVNYFDPTPKNDPKVT